MSRLLVSLHDVAPVHLHLIARAERLFTTLGVPRVTYLYVPRFHGGPDAADDPDFTRWCVAPRPFAVQWFLHGYYHRDDRTHVSLGWRSQLARYLMTAGEGEFIALDADEVRRRLDAGATSFRRTLGVDPIGFVAPAWLWRAPLAAALREHGFRYTEDHLALHDLARHRRVSAPAITWATRSWWRRIGSRVVCPRLARHWSHCTLLRLAVHPFDFDHPATVRSIERVLSELMTTRTIVEVGEPCFE